MENLRAILSASFLFSSVAVKRSPDERNKFYVISTISIAILLIANLIIYFIDPLFDDTIFLISFGLAAIYAIIFDWKSFLFPDRKSVQS
jgi:hypothetical protein